MESIKEKLEHYSSIFRSYKQQIEQIEKEEKQKKVQKEMVPDLTKALTGIPKKYVREAQKFISSPQVDPYDNLKESFDRDFRDFEVILENCIIVKDEGTKSTKKSASYLSKVRKVSLLKTKVRKILEGINQLKLLDRALIYEKDFIPQKKPLEIKKEKIVSPAEELWNNIKSKDLYFLLELDEKVYFDRKQKGIDNQKMENTIVAMTNTHGGIIAFGYSDDKHPFPLSHKKRDGIQNQITDICRNKISPEISPKFESIIEEGDQGHLFVYIPEKDDTLHTNSKQQHLKRVGSNNVRMTAEEIRNFYKR